jgi:hypothetical protein
MRRGRLFYTFPSAVSIRLFRLITFYLMFAGNMRFLATGRLQVTGLNNELSHGVGPIITNWKNPSSQAEPRSLGNNQKITLSLTLIIANSCQVEKLLQVDCPLRRHNKVIIVNG